MKTKTISLLALASTCFLCQLSAQSHSHSGSGKTHSHYYNEQHNPSHKNPSNEPGKKRKLNVIESERDIYGPVTERKNGQLFTVRKRIGKEYRTKTIWSDGTTDVTTRKVMY